MKSSLSTAQPVTNASDGFDDVGPQLLAQGVDIHVHEVRARVEVVTPDMRQELFPAQDLVRVAEQRLEQREFPSGEIDPSVAHRRSPSSYVEANIAGAQNL